MPADFDEASQDDPRLHEILAEYLQASEAGESPNAEQLIRDYPEYADELRDFFADKEHIDEIANVRNVESPSSGEFDMPTLPPERTAINAPTIDSAATSKGSPQPGTVLRYFGDYELLEEIARGGMGVVYKARQVKLNRVVAIKMILAGQLASKEDVQRFYTEAEAAAGLDHPGIVPIFEVGEYNGQHYFSMGFVQGESLAAKHADGPLPPHEGAELVHAVAEAVQYAHERGVIHRDLKPANILLDKDGDPKITDFGLAKQTQSESGMTASGQILGTPSYMPPEQAAGRVHEVRETADVYSLGAILYATLTGRPPFQADNPLDTLMQVLEREPVSSRQLNPNVPRDLETICLKCLDKNRRRRYQSAQDLIDELQRFLEGRPIKARPLGRPARAWRWCKRNPVVASLIVLAVCLLLGGTSTSTTLTVLAIRERDRAEWNAVRATRARDDANDARDEATQARDVAKKQELETRRRAYISDVNLIQQTLARNRLGKARDLLYAQVPKPGQEDQRGWEWRYLWQRCQSQAEYQLTKEDDSIRTMCALHDGKSLAYFSGPKQAVCVWDLTTRQEAQRIPARRQAVCASPTEPLVALVPASQAPEVLVWNAEEGRAVKRLKTRSDARILDFSGDGRFLVANMGGEVIRWRVADWEEVAPRTPTPEQWSHEGGQFDVNMTGNLASYRTKSDVVVIDLEAGETRWRRPGSSEIITALAFSPNSKLLASAAAFSESDIRLWDVETGIELGRLIGHQAFVNDLVFWPDETKLLSASTDQSIRLWDVSRPELPVTLLTLRGHGDQIKRVAPLAGSKRLVSGASNGEVVVWDLDRVESMDPRRILPGSPENWTFATDGDSIITVDKAGRVEQWRGPEYLESEQLFELGNEAVTLTTGPREASSGVCFSSDGRLLAVYLSSGKVVVWNIDERAIACEFPTGKVNARPTLFTDRSERLLISYQGNSSIHLWNLQTGKEDDRPGLRYLFRGSWTLTDDEQWLLGLTQDGHGDLRNQRHGEVKQIKLQSSRGVVGAFNPDNSLFAIASQFGYVRIWDTNSFDGFLEVGEITGVSAAHSLRFNHDGTRLAIGTSRSEAVKYWDVGTQRELLTLEGQGSIFYQLQFSKSGDAVGARPRDGSVHIWRAPSWEEIDAAEAEAGSRSRN